MPFDKSALFCPVVKACDILEPRWTLLILTEMWWGSTRFNEIRRGVPGISPSLLSQRLRQLEAHGLIERIEDPATGKVEYLRTQAGRELEPIIQALGNWAYRNMDADDQLCWIDPKFFMWNLRRNIDVARLPKRRVVFQFAFPKFAGEPRTYWVIAKPGAPVDVCFQDPGFDVDLFISAELRALVSVFFGRSRLGDELKADRIVLTGSPVLARGMGEWLVPCSFARAAQAVQPEAAAERRQGRAGE